jgi:hypothetical protein
MTLAVCLECGELKHGAFTPCQKCGYTPNDDESLTKHLLVTDHFLDSKSLQSIADRVKSGKPIHFDPESLKQAWVSKEQMDAENKRIGRGCLIFFAIILAIAAAILVGTYLLS